MFWKLILGPPLREEGHEVAEGVLLRAEERDLGFLTSNL
jgi:hypothetical protein